MEMPVSEIADRLSILFLKWIHGGDVKEELLVYSREFPVSELFLDLLKVNFEIWKLESAIRQGKEDSLPMEEIGRRALSIRDWNKVRIEIKNKIADIVGENSFREVKIGHASASNKD